ncbi:hypothetical protein [Pelagibius sp. 7325]|uniref:phenylacetate--CoA ligase family protein n=1 Tax=Pelagibius sp. 7325 TaxID=3131994 RepID=UPI0030EBFA9F
MTRPTSRYQPLLSGHPTIAWPALPAPEAARLAALLLQLDASQWWTPEDLRAQQLHQAANLLHHAYRQIPYYRDRLAEAGYLPGKPVTEEVWSRIPILTRSALQEAGTSLYCPEVPKDHGGIYEISSSGSTGQVVTVRGTRLAQAMWDAITLRDHLWHGRDFSAVMAAIRPFAAGVADLPKGGRSASWGRSTHSFVETGPSAVLNVSTSAEQQAEWLLRVQPEYLLTYPSALRDLLIYCGRKSIKIPSLRGVRTLSELLAPEIRELCREIWQLEIVDLYSTQENGYLALQCPESDSYHVQAESVILEVLDENGTPCRPGEVGQVVVTSLLNFAMPLIRYAIGDMAEPGDLCSCGRGLPVLSRILGRVRNTLRYPDGRRGWPMLGDIYHAGVEGIYQYQIVQRSLEDIELRLATAAPLRPVDEDKLREWLRFRSGYPFRVTFSYPPEIPRGPGGKFETFRSELPATLPEKQED